MKKGHKKKACKRYQNLSKEEKAKKQHYGLWTLQKSVRC